MEHFGKLPGVHRRGADIAGLARAHDVVQSFHRLFHRGAVVKSVDLVEVDVVDAQPAQAVVDLGQYGFARQTGAVRAGVHTAVDFCRQHDLVPLGVFPEDLADDLLAAAVRVNVGRVEEVDARIKGLADDGPGRVLVQAPGVARPVCGSPKLMQPRQILETSRPVEPNLVYSTCVLLQLWPFRPPASRVKG